MDNKKKNTHKGFVIFKRILDNKRKIERSIKEGKPVSEIEGIKIAKPLSL